MSVREIDKKPKNITKKISDPKISANFSIKIQFLETSYLLHDYKLLLAFIDKNCQVSGPLSKSIDSNSSGTTHHILPIPKFF